MFGQKRKINNMKKSSKNVCMFFRDVPLDLKNYFKACCDKRGSTMKKELLKFMRDFIKNDWEVDEIKNARIRFTK